MNISQQQRRDWSGVHLYEKLRQSGTIGLSLSGNVCGRCQKTVFTSIKMMDGGSIAKRYVYKNDLTKEWTGEDLENPTGFTCPISKRIMINPAICSNGITYEFEELVRISNETGVLQHVTIAGSNGSHVTLDDMTYPNVVLRNLIREYVEKHGGLPESTRVGANLGLNQLEFGT
jgi:hypothetical protein